MSRLPNDAYWVEPGRLMAGPYPGHTDPDVAVRKLTDLATAGVTHFVDLTFPKGASTDLLEPYGHLLAELPNGNRPGYTRHSIVDVSIPSVELMTTILAEIRERTGQGETVYVHCWGGVGRTGTVVGCWMIENGVPADEVPGRIASLRGGLKRAHRPSPETAEQAEFIRDWSIRASGG